MIRENDIGGQIETNRSGAATIVDSFLRHGLKRVHIFPGGTFAPILAEVEQTDIEIFCPRTEQGAGYAALAEAKLTGEPTVFMVTSGPGVTNAVTPVADAYFDNVPMIILTGQVSTGDMRGDKPVRQRGFQEVDTIDLARPITKAAFLVTDTAELPQVLERAFFLAKEGRPGPVWVDLPMDVQRSTIPVSDFKEPFQQNQETIEIDESKVDELARLIEASERPVILVGGGLISARAHEELRQLADTQQIPVAMSLPGIGAYPTGDRLSLGISGYAGSQYANLSIYNSDLLIGIGTTFHVRAVGSVRDKVAPNANIVGIDIDKNELDFSRVPLDLAIHGDARDVLDSLNKILSSGEISEGKRALWLEQIDRWKDEFSLAYDGKGELKPQYIIELVNRITKGERNLIVATGVGQHQMWVSRHFTFDYPDRTLLTSSGHGTMGYDLPAAIGAKIARPDAKVVCFVGDGSLQMNIQELATVVERGLDIKIIVIDNKALNIVAQFQRQNWKTDPSTGNKYNPDFARIAEAYGIKGYTIKEASEAEGILTTALNTEGPVLVHCEVDPKEDLLPMLLGGHTLDDMSFESSF